MATWRVLTWNLHGSADPELGPLADVIAGLSPDAAALQEVRRSQARRLAKLLGWQHVWARKHHPYTPLAWWRTEGLAIVTPHRLSHTVRMTISPGVSTWTYRHRILLAATITRGHDALRLYDTHLSSDDADERIVQARRVAEQVAADGAPVRVAAGDLNAHDEAEVIRELLATGLADPGGEATNPAVAPVKRLDYVLVPRSARVVKDETPAGGQRWHELSDHLPALVEFDAAVPD